MSVAVSSTDRASRNMHAGRRQGGSKGDLSTRVTPSPHPHAGWVLQGAGCEDPVQSNPEDTCHEHWSFKIQISGDSAVSEIFACISRTDCDWVPGKPGVGEEVGHNAGSLRGKTQRSATDLSVLKLDGPGWGPALASFHRHAHVHAHERQQPRPLSRSRPPAEGASNFGKRKLGRLSGPVAPGKRAAWGPRRTSLLFHSCTLLGLHFLSPFLSTVRFGEGRNECMEPRKKKNTNTSLAFMYALQRTKRFLTLGTQ